MTHSYVSLKEPWLTHMLVNGEGGGGLPIPTTPTVGLKPVHKANDLQYFKCVCVCLCVCLCERETARARAGACGCERERQRERERERERARARVCVCVCVRVCVCVCVYVCLFRCVSVCMRVWYFANMHLDSAKCRSLNASPAVD